MIFFLFSLDYYLNVTIIMVNGNRRRAKERLTMASRTITRKKAERVEAHVVESAHCTFTEGRQYDGMWLGPVKAERRVGDKMYFSYVNPTIDLQNAWRPGSVRSAYVCIDYRIATDLYGNEVVAMQDGRVYVSSAKPVD